MLGSSGALNYDPPTPQLGKKGKHDEEAEDNIIISLTLFLCSTKKPVVRLSKLNNVAVNKIKMAEQRFSRQNKTSGLKSKALNI